MKILLISGENLASLAEPFQVDLAGPAIARSGLFAITGPTGSGKSSILDALCLALFDRVPRFQSSQRFRLDEEQSGEDITSRDARNILRKGTSAARAEVVFVGQDKKTYRSLWQVRRARDRPDGKLQGQTMALFEEATGKEVGDHRKTHTLDLISQKLGLDFDQFRRSVLLAQGDFAAFLEAAPNDRAALLERMTGTTIYSRISRLAFERAKQEKQNLKDIERDLEGIQLLTLDQRKQLQQTVDEEVKKTEDLDQSLRDLDGQIQWYEERQKLKASLEEARAKRDRAFENHENLADLRTEFQRVEKIQPLRHLISASRNAREQCNTAERTQHAAARNEQIAVAKVGESLSAFDQAKTQALEARQALEDMQPVLRKARELDTRIQTATKTIEDRGLERKQLQAKCDEAEERHSSLEIQASETSSEHEELEAWRREHIRDGEIARDWSLHENRLHQFARLLDEKKALAKQLAALETERFQIEEEFAGAERTYIESEKNTALYIKEEESAEKAAAAYDRAAMDKKRRGLETLRERIHRAAIGFREQETIEATLKETIALLATNQKAGEDQESQRLEYEKQKTEHGIRLEEARKAHHIARTAMDLAAHREQLVSGEPCPLCGALEHPYAHNHPDPTDALADRVEVLAGERETLVGKIASIQSRQEVLTGEQEKLESRLEQDQQKADEASKVARELLSILHKDGLIEGLFPSRQNLESQHAKITAQIDGLCQQEDAAEINARRAVEARTRARAARDALKNAFSEREIARGHLDKITAKILGLKEKQEANRQTYDQLATDLSHVLPDPHAFNQVQFTELENRVRVWREKSDRHQVLEKDLHLIQKELVAAGQVLQSQRNTLGPFEKAHQKATQYLDQLRKQRDDLWEGKSADTVEASAFEALKTRETAEEGARKLWEEASKDHHIAKTALENAVVNRNQWRQTLDKHEAELDKECTKIEITREWLPSLFAKGEGWVRETGETLKTSEEEMRHWETLFEERGKKFALHEQAHPGSEDLALLERNRDAQSTELKTARDRLEEARGDLRLDDRHRTQHVQHSGAIEQQRENTAIWEQLNELIGSASGDKFRVFAQGLTLDLLLEDTNYHLQALAPRFRLERVPGQDLEIRVVDGWMGDEVRGVNSLSGGERFLVSLGLALGLASLSTGRTLLETLFIDEGFGALDSNSLDAALSALEALQAGGCTIGVISHLPGIAERIGVRLRVVPVPGKGSRVSIRES